MKESIAKSEGLKVDDTAALVIYYLILKDGVFKGFPINMEQEINERVIDEDSLIRSVSSTAIGKAISRHRSVFDSLFVFSSRRYGAQTIYEFSGFRKGNGAESIGRIRLAVERKFSRCYTRHISPLKIARAIGKAPATLLKKSGVSK